MFPKLQFDTQIKKPGEQQKIGYITLHCFAASKNAGKTLKNSKHHEKSYVDHHKESREKRESPREIARKTGKHTKKINKTQNNFF